MADIKTIAATVNGGDIGNLIAFAVGETVNINLTVIDPNTGTAKDLTSQAVIMTIDAYNTVGNSIRISRQATITNAVAGLCTIPIASGDTYVSASSICRAGRTAADIWVQDVSGNRQLLGVGSINITAIVAAPNATITPLPSQTPLAQGPAGPAGPTGATGPAGPSSPTTDNTTPLGAINDRWSNVFVAATTVKTHSAYTGSEAITQTAAAQTVGAVTVTALTLGLADNTTYRIVAECTGRDAAGVDHAVLGRVACMYREAGGAATQVGTNNTLWSDIHSNPQMALAIATSGNSALVQVTGVAGETINWSLRVTSQAVSTSA